MPTVPSHSTPDPLPQHAPQTVLDAITLLSHLAETFPEQLSEVARQLPALRNEHAALDAHDRQGQERLLAKLRSQFQSLPDLLGFARCIVPVANDSA